jgi:hypothetical protein
MPKEYDIRDLVTEGLNTVYDELGQGLQGITMDQYVQKVTAAAKEWALTCYIDDQERLHRECKP